MISECFLVKQMAEKYGITNLIIDKSRMSVDDLVYLCDQMYAEWICLDQEKSDDYAKRNPRKRSK